jgi:hypothetical protein
VERAAKRAAAERAATEQAAAERAAATPAAAAPAAAASAALQWPPEPPSPTGWAWDDEYYEWYNVAQAEAEAEAAARMAADAQQFWDCEQVRVPRALPCVRVCVCA